MGFNLASILGGNLGEAFQKIVGTFKLSPEKKAELQQAIAENENALALKQFEIEKGIQDQITAELNAKRDIIVAELQQADNYTKRARPTVIYFGLVAIFLIHVLLPFIAYFGDKPMPSVTLPEDFWWTWGAICATYAVGRTAEKMGYKNKAISLITGNQ